MSVGFGIETLLSANTTSFKSQFFTKNVRRLDDMLKLERFYVIMCVNRLKYLYSYEVKPEYGYRRKHLLAKFSVINNTIHE